MMEGEKFSPAVVTSRQSDTGLALHHLARSSHGKSTRPSERAGGRAHEVKHLLSLDEPAGRASDRWPLLARAPSCSLIVCPLSVGPSDSIRWHIVSFVFKFEKLD